MKYRGVRALPASVALWLEQQLEERGIDSIIYTRYILSLLQDDSIDLSDLPSLSEESKKNWNTCNLEELRRTAVVECLSEASDQEFEIESLVDELCLRLKAVKSDDTGNCLKEKTNSEDLFNLELPPVSCPDLGSRYYSAFPALSRDSIAFDSSLLEKSAWTKNICRALGRRRDLEGSPKENKITKRKEGKENARGRMRSISTVKGPNSQRSRSAMAKSLDRSEKGRKCLFGKEEKSLSTSGREEEFEKFLPMDLQSLLQSPDNIPPEMLRNKNAEPFFGNFIQCGTNITSSIWSEKMEEDESVPWEEAGKYVGWSDARNSLLSSAWKIPFVYGNTDNKKEEDIEETALDLKNKSAYFSLFNDNSNHLSLMKATKQISKSEQKEVEPPEQLENLLTSMKTHFKPIKQDQESVSSGGDFNDGSSFVGANGLDEVQFQRSESGSLFLGHDQKYMEYKRTDLNVSPEFVPKFRVSSNEKFCQTDDPPPVEENSSALDEKIESEFFFPGDDTYAEDALNETHFKVSGWVTTWPVIPATNDIWRNDVRQPWGISENENWSSADGVGKREDYTRLCHEITQEGEQLLSDLSSISLLQEHRPQNVLLIGSSGM